MLYHTTANNSNRRHFRRWIEINHETSLSALIHKYLKKNINQKSNSDFSDFLFNIFDAFFIFWHGTNMDIHLWKCDLDISFPE
jgi:hypothetical protein